MNSSDERQIEDSPHQFIWWIVPARIVSIIVCMFFLLPTTFYRVFGTGRDPNWEIVLHYAREKGLVFGSDISFTYGPLGFLYARLAYPGVAEFIGAWDILSYTCILLTLAICISSLRSISELATISFICVCIGVYRQPLDVSILYLFFTLFFTAHFVDRNSTVFGILAWSFAVISFFLKVSCGLIAMLTIIGSTIFLVIFARERKASIISLIFGALFFGLMLLLLPIELFAYLSNSLEFLKGYPEAMYKVDPNNRYYLTMALVSFALFGLGILSNARKLLTQPSKLFSVILSAGLLFVLFKQGFVRADSHIRDFFQYAPLTLGIFYILAEAQQRKHYAIFAIALTTFSFSIQEDRFSYEYVPKKVALIKHYLETFGAKAPAGHIPTGFAPPKPLSDKLLAKIGSDSVDVVTFQSYQLIRSKLNYTPRPVIHSYAAYTKKLDELNANHFNSSRAPKFILYSHIRLDDRYPFFDESRTRQVIRQWYKPVMMSDGFVLLERQLEPKSFSLKALPSGISHANMAQRIELPSSKSPLYLSANIKYSALGKLISFFYRPPPCYIELFLADGRVIRARAIPNQLKGGVLVNKAILSPGNAASFFNSQDDDLSEITAFRLESSWKWAVLDKLEFQLHKAE